MVYTELVGWNSNSEYQEQKEKMRVVKLSLVFLLFSALGCSAQKTISGTFIKNISNRAWSDVTVTFNFQDTTFKKILHGITITNVSGDKYEAKSVSGGNYEIKGDTLILNYQPPENSYPSSSSKIYYSDNVNTKKILIKKWDKDKIVLKKMQKDQKIIFDIIVLNKVDNFN